VNGAPQFVQELLAAKLACASAGRGEFSTTQLYAQGGGV
jgi:hypothetical protein